MEITGKISSPFSWVLWCSQGKWWSLLSQFLPDSCFHLYPGTVEWLVADEVPVEQPKGKRTSISPKSVTSSSAVLFMKYERVDRCEDFIPWQKELNRKISTVIWIPSHPSRSCKTDNHETTITCGYYFLSWVKTSRTQTQQILDFPRPSVPWIILSQTKLWSKLHYISFSIYANSTLSYHICQPLRVILAAQFWKRVPFPKPSPARYINIRSYKWLWNKNVPNTNFFSRDIYHLVNSSHFVFVMPGCKLKSSKALHYCKKYKD